MAVRNTFCTICPAVSFTEISECSAAVSDR